MTKFLDNKLIIRNILYLIGGKFLGLDICETIQSHSIFCSKRLRKLGWSYHTKVINKPYVKTQP
jgi:hypothetical protein